VNIYVVVEGEATEREVYRCWIPYANPTLVYVDHIGQVTGNNFLIIAGFGYPQYFDVVDAAIADVNENRQFDRLVIAVDSEEISLEERYTEIYDHVSGMPCRVEIRIVIQHFCLETWALGNRSIMSPSSQGLRLRQYKRFFDVSRSDPELMPGYPAEELNRSQFALRYLVCALQERYRNLTYIKSRPKALLNPKYFEKVRRRLMTTGHIHSFQAFLDAFH
jgi:hypothetical protein